MTSTPDVPPFIGYVETTVHALRLIYAAQNAIIPRITRRLNDGERRNMIKSGSVFVFGVEESGIKRWTDGLLWSPSRIVGNFLVYREINERTSSRGGQKKVYPPDDPTSRVLSRRNSPEHLGYKNANGQDQGTFKPGGLIKKTITVTIDGADLHLISYYTSEDIRSGKLKRPTSRPDIMGVYMPPHIFRLTNFRVPPKVEIGPDGKPRLVCEQEDLQDMVECKVEEQIYSIPNSPSWGHPNSPSSPVDAPFAGNGSLYPVGNAVGYHRSSGHDRWSVSHEGNTMSSVGRNDLSWTSSTGSLGPPNLVRRREHNVLQDSWPSIQTQSTRWQDSSNQLSISPTSSSGYPDRSQARVRAGHPYDHGEGLRRENEGVGRHSRESSSHRMAWHQHQRESSHSSRDRRSPQSSFNTPSPTLPFSSQGYHATTPAYTSAWTPNDNTMMNTPTLHTITTSSAYGNSSYSSNSNTALSGGDEFGTVEDFAEA